MKNFIFHKNFHSLNGMSRMVENIRKKQPAYPYHKHSVWDVKFSKRFFFYAIEEFHHMDIFIVEMSSFRMVLQGNDLYSLVSKKNDLYSSV